MVDIKKWQDRVENLLQVQKDLCLEQISTTFTRSELIELRLLLNEMTEIKNNKPSRSGYSGRYLKRVFYRRIENE